MPVAADAVEGSARFDAQPALATATVAIITTTRVYVPTRQCQRVAPSFMRTASKSTPLLAIAQIEVLTQARVHVTDVVRESSLPQSRQGKLARN
jgi:hypothetical protein